VLTKTEARDTRRIAAATLRAFLSDALRACGLNEADAATVAGAMLEADLTARMPTASFASRAMCASSSVAQ
jgi:hypothetical protein